jgi:hypothetical protein
VATKERQFQNENLDARNGSLLEDLADYFIGRDLFRFGLVGQANAMAHHIRSKFLNQGG